ncbi:MAG: type VI secretion system-associated FHA domain protein TagH [Ketobacteraceae bacterium]|nr:type VI secretion system-associated FHA domain protein TagH [Ketobacteraceae bacterium]
MELILEMTSDERHLIGASARKTFKAAGGVIGRDPGCDWFIPDESRHLSGRHALISCEGDGFYITDISTNGVFVNGQSQPLGKERRIRLNDADRISMGNMDFVVRLQLDPEAVPYRSLSEGTFAGSNPVRPSPGGQRQQQLDPLAMFRAANGSPDPAGGKGAAPDVVSPHSRAEQVVSAPDHRPAAQRAFTPPNMLPEDWLGEPVVAPAEAEMPPRPQPRQAKRSSPAPQVPSAATGRAAPAPDAGQDYERLVKSLFRGLGVSPNILARVDGEKVMEEMGAALKANMKGMVALMQQRAQLKNDFRMDMTLVKSRGNNPLKFSADSKQAMKHLFKPDVASFLSVSESFDECYQDMQLHQLALLAATQSAMREVFRVLSPDRIEQRAEKDRSGLSLTSKSHRCWKKYLALHEELMSEDDEFNHLFGDAFVRAFDHKVRSARKTTQGKSDGES